MSWPVSDETWLDPEQTVKLNRAQYIVRDYKFWEYVDSQQNANSHPDECWPHDYIPGARVWLNKYGLEPREQFCRDWRHLRDADGLYCLAAKSDLNQCGKRAALGTPFCDFHFDKAWMFLRSAVLVARGEQVELDIKWDRDEALRRHGIDVAAVYDARAALARSPERVYFYLADNAVKVGRSINPEQRVRTLGGTKAPEGVDIRAGRLLGTIPGGSKTESALHLCYRPHHLVGEWFEYAPIAEDIASVIAEYAEAAA